MVRAIDPGEVRARLADVIAAMRATNGWDVARPADTAFADLGAFGARTMAFGQWLRWVFVPNVEELVAAGGPWPTDSMVAVQATREELDDALVRALTAFDELFAGDRRVDGFRAGAAAGDATAIAALGDALVAAGRASEAVAELHVHANAGSAEAHNWLGWWLTEREPDLPHALEHLHEATRRRPEWGAAWVNYAKAFDAAGNAMAACAALGNAIGCGNAPDDAFARDRRVQLDLMLRARGERPPAPPEQAAADTAAVDVLQAAMAHAELATGRTFFIRPTARTAGEVAFAAVCVVVAEQARAAAIVEHVFGTACLALTLTRGAAGEPLTFRRASITNGDARDAAAQLADWVRGELTALTPLDAAFALHAACSARWPLRAGWRVRASGDSPASVTVSAIGTSFAVTVSALAGGGVTVALPDREADLATPADLVAHLDTIVAAIGEAELR
jgi:uncharacterized protein YqcC (DUF446 family)